MNAYYTSQQGFDKPRFYDINLSDENRKPVPDYLLRRRMLFPVQLIPDVTYFYNALDGDVAYRRSGVYVEFSSDGRLLVRAIAPLPEYVATWKTVQMGGTYANGINVVSTSAGWLVGEHLVLPIMSSLSTILEHVIS